MAYMQKHRIDGISILLSLVLLTSCAYVDDLPKDETMESAAEITNTFQERLAGIYKTHSEENGETIMQIYRIQELLIAEVEEEYAAYYAMEWIPEHSQEEVTDVNREEFTVYTFSGFSNEGAYRDNTSHITVTLNETGLEIEEEDGNTTSYICDEEIEPIHNPERYRDLFGNVSDCALTGHWSAVLAEGYALYLRIDADGTMLWSCKKTGQPVTVYIGIASAEQDTGIMQVMAEKVGWAQMPWLFELQYSIGAGGSLILTNTETNGMLPADHAIQFEKVTEQE